MSLVIRKRGRSCAAATFAALCLSGMIGPAHADTVTDWNATAAALPMAAAPVLARVMATMHGAMVDAIGAIEPRYEPYRFRVEAPAGASEDAAVAAAAHDVLVALAPSQKGALDAALAQSLARVHDERAKADGILVGERVAERFLAWRAKDNFDAKAEDRPGTRAGAWQRTPPGYEPGVLPQFGGVTPFLIESVDPDVAEGRPRLSSPQFARDLDEIRRLGGRRSTGRSAEQTAVAVFWTGNEILQLNAVARAVSQARKLSMPENARLFALVHMAAADALIVSFRIKYRENAWRPITAIRAGSGGAAADPDWESLLVTPPHPEFPSAHCMTTGAVAQVLRELFGSDEVKVGYVYPPGLGMVRDYTSLTQLEREVEDARVYAGIHFRSTDRFSTELGRRVGAEAVARYPRLAPAPAPETSLRAPKARLTCTECASG